MPSPHVIIAIDGPAASGKSSVAQTLAKRIGYTYVNTGAMYRAITWFVTSSHIDPSNNDAILQLLNSTSITCEIHNQQSSIFINGQDPSPHLTSESVNHSVSTIASIPEVRRQLVALQRACADHANCVMEGRDIGSAVFPESPYKFYIDASVEVRAQRRAKQGLQDSIAQRDKIDSSRKTSPLVIAEDAHVIDSSHLTIDGVVGEIIGRLKLKNLLPKDF